MYPDYIILYDIKLYIILYYVRLYYIILYYTILFIYCMILYYVILYYIYYIILYYIIYYIIWYIILYYIILCYILYYIQLYLCRDCIKENVHLVRGMIIQTEWRISYRIFLCINSWRSEHHQCDSGTKALRIGQIQPMNSPYLVWWSSTSVSM